jgi:sigma-B regulation protein RsbQ
MNPQELLQATVEGEGEDTVVFGNGFGTTSASWDAIVAALPPGWRAVRFDYVGTTPDTAPAWLPARYATYEGHADDLARLLSHLDITDAVFVGHSMSGMVGGLATLLAPGRIGHLMMIGASPCYARTGEYDGGFAPADIAEVLRRADTDLDAWMSGFGRGAMGPDATPHMLEAYLAALRALRPDIGRTLVRSIFESDYRALLPQLTCDVSVLQTARDAAVPTKVAHYIAAHTRCESISVLDLDGHLPHVTHPQLVVPALRRILDRHRRARRARSAPAPRA